MRVRTVGGLAAKSPRRQGEAVGAISHESCFGKEPAVSQLLTPCLSLASWRLGGQSSLLVLALMTLLVAGEEAKTDPHYPFRTDWANTSLPWYQLKPGEFPPYHSDHRVSGVLIAANFYHRSGTFRTSNGELVDFTMPPFGTVYHLNAEAELRDVPLGTFFLFFLHQDEHGAFTRVATMQDEYSMLAGHGFTYRLDEATPEKLKVTKQKKSDTDKPNVGTNELLVDAATRVWKGDQRIALGDLKPGDDLLINLTGQNPRHCSDVWVGAETHQHVTDAQRKKHATFLKERGLPAWIDRVDGKKVTVTLFASDRANMQAFLKNEGIDPAHWAKEQRSMQMAVADQTLRTYNPPVDNQRSTWLEVLPAPTDCYGCSGERWVIEPNLLLEGFRPGRIVRLFVHGGWKVEDMPFGEGIYEHGFEPNDDIAELYPYRTDALNQHLPWYQPKAGAFPPDHSAHRIGGELVAIDAAKRTGRFHSDRSGTLVDFALPPYGSVLHLGAEAELTDVPLGTHCWFDLHQDAKGAFTRAAVVSDDYTELTIRRLTYRVDEVDQVAGRLRVACQIPQIKNYQDVMITPPDVGRCELTVDAKTRIWKGEQQVKLSDLVAGDLLLANRTTLTSTSQGTCTDLWVGADTHKAVSERQRLKHRALVKAAGMPALIDAIDGKKLTILFIAGLREDFPPLLDGDPWGKPVFVWHCDDLLQRQGEVDKMGLNNHTPELNTAGTYGCSGIRWVIETQKPEIYAKGQVIRVFKEGWPLPADSTAPAAPAK